jgi:hypothetical protein
MAHFAEIELKTDPTGFTTEDKYIVKRVVVVGNDVPAGITTLGQNDMHEDGEFHCKKIFNGGIWKQTSYNHNFRKRYAGRGSVYDLVNDVFHGQQPYASWTLNTTEWVWESPVAYPSITSVEIDGVDYAYRIEWSEANQEWIGYKSDVQFQWNTETSSWDATGG